MHLQIQGAQQRRPRHSKTHQQISGQGPRDTQLPPSTQKVSPTHILRACTHKSLNPWGVEESFHTSIFYVVREGVLTKSGLQTLGLVSSRFREMSRDVPRLLGVDFSSLTQTRLGYESQEEIDNNRVEKLSAAAVYYGLDLGLVTHCLG